MIEVIKELIKKLIDLFDNIWKVILKIVVFVLVVTVLVIIVIITINASFSSKIVGTCIEADEFGTKNDRILAQPQKDSDYMVNNTYKHEEIRQKIVHTDLGLSLNGEPLTINITGQWIPWLYYYKENNKTNSIWNSFILENEGMPDKKFFCALEKYNLIEDAGMNFAFSTKNEENEFYYIRNYYKSIARYKNEGTTDVSIQTSSGSETVAPGKTIVYGEEELPERQKECWITRGAGLYLGSYGVSGRTQPTAYHHLIASKMMCSKQYWFNGSIKSDNDVIVKYKKPIGVDYNNCSCSDNETRKCNTEKGALKNEDLGTCSIYTNDNNVGKEYYKNANVTIECDCKKYGDDIEYTYLNFKENYFDVNYHLTTPLTDQNDISINKQIINSSGSQIIYNIDLHEKLLYAKGVQNVGYIIASSMEKFTNACYKLQKSIDGNVERDYKSYFQYGPKYIYKNAQNRQDVKYSYGEQIKMFIADKYYKDNDGFYKIEILSGIDLDSVGSFESKLQEIEFFLLGTPNPGDEDDRVDGMIATIFNNILNSTFVDIARLIMILMVITLGFRIIFGFAKKDLEKTNLIKLLIKIIILTILLSPEAFQFFNKYVINFFINGTIGLIDLSAKIFSNSFMESEVSLIGGFQYTNTTGSLSRNYAIVDEILAFFEGYAVTAKAISFFFAVGEKFLVGWFVSTAIFLVLLFYVAKLLHSIVPFIFTLLQLTLVLPMAPVCLALSLIKQTESYLKQWISTVLSKCLQLIAFFIAFYFCTSIINNFIRSLLSFKVCFVPLGEYLMPSVDSSINVTGITDFFEMNWLQEIVKKILNSFVAARFEGLPNNWFIYYCINIAIITALVYLFDTITNTVMSMVGGILNIDGASGSGGVLSKTGNFGLRAQMSNFAGMSGLANLQKNSKLLSWTRNVFDLSEQDMIGGNLKNIAKKVGGTANKFDDAVRGNLWRAIKGRETNFKNDMKKVASKVTDDIVGGEKAKGSIFDAKTWGNEGSRLDHKSWGENKHSNKNSALDKNNLKDKKEYKDSSSWAERAKRWVDDPKNYMIDKYSRLSDDDRYEEISKILELDKNYSKTGVEKELKKLKIGEIFGEENEKLMHSVIKLYKNGLIDEETMESIITSLSDKLKDPKDDVNNIMNGNKLRKELIEAIAKTLTATNIEENIDFEGGMDRIIKNRYKSIILAPKVEGFTNEDNFTILENDSVKLLEEDAKSLINESIEDLLYEDASSIINKYSGDLLDSNSEVIIGNIKKTVEEKGKDKIKELKEQMQSKNKKDKKQEKIEQEEYDAESSESDSNSISSNNVLLTSDNTTNKQ